jgi:para-nitrobenzyl esterase
MGEIAVTRAGRVEGTRERSVLVFRGIPYARAPRGELRFRPPEPPEPWRDVRRATRFAPAAPQGLPPVPLVRALIGGGAQSQDSLYLNVWTPALDGRRRPVMVWIHGGAFVMGAGSTRLYWGARMAERGDVVVVTINYRLGALGFLYDPALVDRPDGVAANTGLRDQVAALEWVRDNVLAFGGDPANVTIFGESAGAMSVGTLLAVPRAAGLFHRAILQSGAASHVSSAERAGQVAHLFYRELGLNAPAPDALRAAAVSDILRAQREAAMHLGFREGMLPWQPVVDGDFLPEAPLAAIARGAGHRVPTLVGTNRDEWKLFMLGDGKGRRLSEEALGRRVLALFGGDPAVAARALEVYRAAGRGHRHPSELWEALQSDRIFHYPAMRLADAQSGAGAPTWRYLFSWTPPLLLEKRLGACHGIEIPFVFGTLRDRFLRLVLGSTRASRGLSSRMQEAWIAFARDGRPASERLPDWPAWDARTRATMELDVKCAVESAPFAEECAFWHERLA